MTFMPTSPWRPPDHEEVESRDLAKQYERAGIVLFHSSSGRYFVPEKYAMFRRLVLVLQRRIRTREYIPPFYRQQYFGQWKRWFERRDMEEMLRHFHRFQEGKAVTDDYRDLFGYFVEYCLNDETIPIPPAPTLSPDDPVFK